MKFHIDNILQVSKLDNALDFERASTLYNVLGWMVEENPSLGLIKDHSFLRQK